LKPGHVLLFYRSQSRQARAIGVVEESLASQSAEAISHFVGRRTVYDYTTIRRFCAQGTVLARRSRWRPRCHDAPGVETGKRNDGIHILRRTFAPGNARRAGRAVTLRRGRSLPARDARLTGSG
jgi:hypothetical protein